MSLPPRPPRPPADDPGNYAAPWTLEDIELSPGVTMKQVSSACQAEMHTHCLDWDLCGCTVCHKFCGNVTDCPAPKRMVRSVYQLPGGLEVCSACYRRMAPPVGRTTACEACGSPSAYRHPGTGDDRYLCPGCHIEAGHPRKQDRGE